MSKIIRDLTEDELTSVAGGDLRAEVAQSMNATDAAKISFLFDPPRFSWETIVEGYVRDFR